MKHYVSTHGQKGAKTICGALNEDHYLGADDWEPQRIPTPDEMGAAARDWERLEQVRITPNRKLALFAVGTAGPTRSVLKEIDREMKGGE